jgi:hypothetical protein
MLFLKFFVSQHHDELIAEWLEIGKKLSQGKAAPLLSSERKRKRERNTERERVGERAREKEKESEDGRRNSLLATSGKTLIEEIASFRAKVKYKKSNFAKLL